MKNYARLRTSTSLALPRPFEGSSGTHWTFRQGMKGSDQYDDRRLLPTIKMLKHKHVPRKRLMALAITLYLSWGNLILSGMTLIWSLGIFCFTEYHKHLSTCMPSTLSDTLNLTNLTSCFYKYSWPLFLQLHILTLKNEFPVCSRLFYVFRMQYRHSRTTSNDVTRYAAERHVAYENMWNLYTTPLFNVCSSQICNACVFLHNISLACRYQRLLMLPEIYNQSIKIDPGSASLIAYISYLVWYIFQGW